MTTCFFGAALALFIGLAATAQAEQTRKGDFGDAYNAVHNAVADSLSSETPPPAKSITMQCKIATGALFAECPHLDFELVPSKSTRPLSSKYLGNGGYRFDDAAPDQEYRLRLKSTKFKIQSPTSTVSGKKPIEVVLNK